MISIMKNLIIFIKYSKMKKMKYYFVIILLSNYGFILSQMMIKRLEVIKILFLPTDDDNSNNINEMKKKKTFIEIKLSMTVLK